MMKKTTIKKLNELLKEGQNIAIFQMLNYSKLIDYLCKYKKLVIKECLNNLNITTKFIYIIYKAHPNL
jgi:hypothetical protein